MTEAAGEPKGNQWLGAECESQEHLNKMEQDKEREMEQVEGLSNPIPLPKHTCTIFPVY